MSTRTDTERLAWLAKSCTCTAFSNLCQRAYENWGRNPVDWQIALAFRDAIDKALDEIERHRRRDG